MAKIDEKFWYRKIGRDIYHQTETSKRLHREQNKRQYDKVKLDVFIHYGGNPPKCACCGESGLRFLTIDHINNDGGKHRKLGLTGARLYRWLIKNNFPKEFQILCYNCNCGRARNGGICPHKKGLNNSTNIVLQEAAKELLNI